MASCSVQRTRNCGWPAWPDGVSSGSSWRWIEVDLDVVAPKAPAKAAILSDSVSYDVQYLIRPLALISCEKARMLCSGTGSGTGNQVVCWSAA